MALRSFERHERAFEGMRPNPFTQGDEVYEDSEDEEFEDNPGFPEPDPDGASNELFKFFGGPEDRRQTFSQGRLLHHVLREGIGLQGHGGFVGEASQRATRAPQSALQEGVGLGENATRRIRSLTPWPRQIGGRDDAHRANSPGTR